MYFLNLDGVSLTMDQVESALREGFPHYPLSFSTESYYTVDRATGRFVKAEDTCIHVAFDRDAGGMLRMDPRLQVLRMKPWYPRVSLRVLLSLFGFGHRRQVTLRKEVLDFLAERFGGQVQHPRTGLRGLQFGLRVLFGGPSALR